MSCERGGNYKKNNSFEDSYIMKVKCPFMLRPMSNGNSWEVMARCAFHNHKLVPDLDIHGILNCLKDDER